MHEKTIRIEGEGSVFISFDNEHLQVHGDVMNGSDFESFDNDQRIRVGSLRIAYEPDVVQAPKSSSWWNNLSFGSMAAPPSRGTPTPMPHDLTIPFRNSMGNDETDRCLLIISGNVSANIVTPSRRDFLSLILQQDASLNVDADSFIREGRIDLHHRAKLYGNQKLTIDSLTLFVFDEACVFEGVKVQSKINGAGHMGASYGFLAQKTRDFINKFIRVTNSNAMRSTHKDYDYVRSYNETIRLFPSSKRTEPVFREEYEETGGKIIGKPAPSGNKYNFYDHYKKFDRYGNPDQYGEYDQYGNLWNTERYDKNGKFDKYGEYDQYSKRLELKELTQGEKRAFLERQQRFAQRNAPVYPSHQYSERDLFKRYDRERRPARYGQFDENGEFLEYERFDQYGNPNIYGEFDRYGNRMELRELSPAEIQLFLSRQKDLSSTGHIFSRTKKFQRFDQYGNPEKYGQYDKNGALIKYTRFDAEGRPDEKGQYDRYGNVLGSQQVMSEFPGNCIQQPSKQMTEVEMKAFIRRQEKLHSARGVDIFDLDEDENDYDLD